MKAMVVYESLWGNTAAIARAIAEGLGPDTPAFSTDEATPEALPGVGLIVAGAPLLGFTLPTDEIRQNISRDSSMPASDTSHPSMRSWLAELPEGTGRSVAFETRIWWSPGSAARKISAILGAKGYASIAPDERFIVTDRFGPLRDGEIERARAWGKSLSNAMRSVVSR